jgi:3-hydroxymyristoyl/3-hydroxydecanoyl-(acyl carrier protein) dehydratase
VIVAQSGQFHLLPRGDRIEKVEGRRVSLTRVEEALRAIPDVTAAIVCTLPSRKAALGAVVVLSHEGRARLAEQGAFRYSRDLRRALAVRLEPSERPKHWRFVGEMPVDERGKPNQAMLRALFLPPLHGIELDIIAQSHDTAKIRLKLSRDVTYFAGHFADRAILPGVAQIHIAAQIAHSIWHFRPDRADLARVKFSRVLVPDDEIVVVLERDERKGRLRFTYSVGDVTASQGDIG